MRRLGVRQWRDIRGNAKFYIITLLLSGGGTTAVKWVLGLTAGLSAWQQIAVSGSLIVSFLGWIVSTIWAFNLRKELRYLPGAIPFIVPTRAERLGKLRELYMGGPAPNEDNLRPCVIASYEKRAVLVGGELSVIEFLRLHNIGWETAANVTVDSILLIEEEPRIIASFLGQPIGAMDRDGEAFVQFFGSVIDGVRTLSYHHSGFTMPLVVRYVDRGGKKWDTLHALKDTSSGLLIEPVRHGQRVAFTKFL